MNSTHSNSHSNRAAHAREATHAHSVYDTATHLPAFAINPSVTPEDLFSHFWTPGLLDRLQAPITRYRE
jgi:hypothetical protein